MAEPTVDRADLEGALEARRELGPAYEPHVIDSFLEKVERRIDERMKEHRPPRREPTAGAVSVLSLVLAIPMLGIAGGTAGLPGIVAVCAALVLINLFARR